MNTELIGSWSFQLFTTLIMMFVVLLCAYQMSQFGQQQKIGFWQFVRAELFNEQTLTATLVIAGLFLIWQAGL